MSENDARQGSARAAAEARAAYRSLAQALEQIPDSSCVLIALSGGLDSSSLLRLAVPLLRERGVKVNAIHVNHGYSPNAAAWERFCLHLCREYGLECIIEPVSVKVAGEGWEAAARRQRYQAFQKHVVAGGIVLQAHHLDDQIETLFMRVQQRRHLLMLSGIPKERPLGLGRVYRPWLNIPGHVIEQVARHQAWRWVEDESNQDVRFERNRIRHHSLPVLQRHYPRLADDLLALSGRVARLKLLKQRLLDSVLEACADLCSVNSTGTELAVAGLSRFSRMAQEDIVRHWIDRAGVAQPSGIILARLWTEVLIAQSDKSPMIQWGACQLRRYADRLYLLNAANRLERAPPDQMLCLGAKRQVVEFGAYVIEILPAAELEFENENEAESVLVAPPSDGAPLWVRARSGVERPMLRTASGSVPIKRIFRQLSVPPWRRANRPLLMCGDELVWAGGRLVSDRYRARPDLSGNATGYRFILSERAEFQGGCGHGKESDGSAGN